MSRIKKLTTFDKENNISDEYSYEYDRAGNKIKAEKRREDRTNVYHYSYDKLDRIIKVTDEKKLSEIYSYDRAGNRISKEKRDETGNILLQEKYIYDRQNKLISADGLKELLGDKVYGTVRFEYDKRGNTTRIKDSSKVIGEYEFSKENLLARATNRNGEVTTFRYDGAGRRVRLKVENPNEKLTKEYKYINDPTTPYSTILMRYGKDKQTEKYIHGIGHESTEKLNQWKETERTFYTHNELGSQIREYDDKGTTTNSYEYDIFGVPSFREDSYNYTGYTNDSSTNLMFAQARYYLPEIGRFISEDSYKGTLPDTQSQNRYIYCTNNPLKYVDPSGYHPEITKWLTPIPIVGAAYNVGEGVYHVATGTDPEDGWEEWQGRTNESAMWTAGAGEAIAWYKMTGFTVLGITKFTNKKDVPTPVLTQVRGDSARTKVVTTEVTTAPYPKTNIDTSKDTGRYGVDLTNIENSKINKGLGKNTKGTITNVSDTSKKCKLETDNSKPETGNMDGNGIKNNNNIIIVDNDIINKKRVGSGLKVDYIKPITTINERGQVFIEKEFPSVAQQHGFNNIIDNYAGLAEKFSLDRGAVLYQIEGSLNGVRGRFEWITQYGNVTHRMFIKDGIIRGVPIIK